MVTSIRNPATLQKLQKFKLRFPNGNFWPSPHIPVAHDLDHVKNEEPGTSLPTLA